MTTTKTCSKCQVTFQAYWRGIEMPDRCRKCEYRYSDKARSKARRAAMSAERGMDTRKSSDIRPKHVVGEVFSETWFHSQQTAWVSHMGRLGIPKTGPKPATGNGTAGDSPFLGLGLRF